MKQEQLDSLIQNLVDGSITQEQFDILDVELRSNPSSMTTYLSYVDLDNIMILDLAGKRHNFVPVIPIERIASRQKRRAFNTALIAAAAVLLLSLFGMKLFFIDAERSPTLVFETAPGTQFFITHNGEGDTPEGMVLEKGSRLRISQGTIELTFKSGVKSIVMAPADLTLHDDDTLFLREGTAWFNVPKQAIEFQVKTKDLDIVDLGTEFGVSAIPDNHDEVHVFKGKVQVTANRVRRESAVLLAGQARRIDPIGRLEVIPAKTTAFLSNLPKTLPYLHWSFDKGDGFQVSGPHPALADIITTAHPAHNLPKLIQGKKGTALSLNGKNQHLLTNWAGITEGRPRTVAFWARIPKGVDLTGRPAIVGWGTPRGSNLKWKVQITHDALNKFPSARVTYGSEWFHGETRLDDNQWHHFTAVYHGRTSENGLPDTEIFVDGQRENLTHLGKGYSRAPLDLSPAQNQLTQSYPLTIGKGLEPQKITFRGEIDELYIYEGALTQKAIRRLMISSSE